MSKETLLSIPPKRILIPRLDTLGDIVLLEGFLEALLQRYPQANVTVLVRRVFADLASLFPENLEWLTTDNIEPNTAPPDLSLGRRLLAALDGATWNLVLTTTYSRTWADDLVAASMNRARRLALGQWSNVTELTRRVFEGLSLGTDCPFDQMVPVSEKSHEVEKYQVFWQALAGESALPAPRLYINEHQKRAADMILQSEGLKAKSFCLCFPAGTQRVAIKTWPQDRFAQMVAWLEQERGLPSLIAGHRSEAGHIEEVMRLAEEKGAKPRKWLGRDGEIPILAALLEAASFYLGNDTGPMHIAAAVKTPVIAIFGGGTWPRFNPLGEHSIALAGEMPCFGCAWECMFGDAPCMRLVTVGDAKQAVADLLGGAVTSSSGIFRASTKLSPKTSAYIQKAIKIHREINEDRRARLEANRRLEIMLKESEADRAARLETIQQLSGQIATLESDRAARLETIEILSRDLSEVEADRAARLQLIGQLESRLHEVEADRAARLETIQHLSGQMAAIESDRAARLQLIGQLESRLHEVEADRADRLEIIQQLSGQIAAIESDRAARLEIIEKLSRNLSEVEADRTARLHVIEELDKELNQTKCELMHTGQNLEETQRELARIRGALSVRILSKIRLIPS